MLAMLSADRPHIARLSNACTTKIGRIQIDRSYNFNAIECLQFFLKQIGRRSIIEFWEDSLPFQPPSFERCLVSANGYQGDYCSSVTQCLVNLISMLWSIENSFVSLLLFGSAEPLANNYEGEDCSSMTSE